MASLEVWKKDGSVDIHDVADAGGGLFFKVAPPTNNYGQGAAIWFGNRQLSNLYEELPVSTAEACSFVADKEGWAAVYINGRAVWSDAAARAVEMAVSDALDFGEPL